jgi:predicted metalloenzyme YecM
MMNNFRNRLARKITNFAMNHIATKEYSEAMTKVIYRGMLASGGDWQQVNGKK